MYILCRKLVHILVSMHAGCQEPGAIFMHPLYPGPGQTAPFIPSLGPTGKDCFYLSVIISYIVNLTQQC